jgi:putative transposase
LFRYCLLKQPADRHMVYVCKFTEDEIVDVLREHEAGADLAELCHRHNFSIRTFYRWKARLGRVPLSVAMRVKELEDENARLRALLVETMLSNGAPPAREKQFTGRAEPQKPLFTTRTAS